VLVGAGLGLALTLALHLRTLAAAGPPAAPWSWLIHGGAIGGCWWVAACLRAAGLRGVGGLLRVRKMVPIPLRLALAAATLNALVAAGLAAAGGGLPGRALTAYWLMMYLLVSILAACVVVRLRAAEPRAAGREDTAR
jgi:hypothetical protein